MSYGPPIHVVLTDGSVPQSAYNPGRSGPWPEDPMPVMKDASASMLGRQNTLIKRLPAMPASEMGDLSFTNGRQEEVAAEMYAMARAADERKAYEQRSRKISRAKNRYYSRLAEKRTRLR